MSLFGSFVNGVGKGYRNARGGGNAVHRLLGELGWSVDEHHDNSTIGLLFKGDHVAARRMVLVTYDPGDPVIIFWGKCGGLFTERTLPTGLMEELLLRNKLDVGSWYASVHDDVAGFIYRYVALTAGVDADAFRTICEKIVGEVAAVESLLHQQGLM